MYCNYCILAFLHLSECLVHYQKRKISTLRGYEKGELHNSNVDPSTNFKMRENLLGLVFITLIKLYPIHFGHFYAHSPSHKALT